MRGKRLGRAVLLTTIAAVAASCGQDETPDRRALPDHTPFSRSGEAREERQLTQAELDTLRSFKQRLRVTRDQYWDGRGGVLGNEWVTVWYPAGNLTPTHGMAVLDRVDRARGQARLLFGRVPGEMLTIVCSESMESYGEETGREWWQYSRIEGDKIVLQPVATIALRGLIEIVPAREYYEWTIGKLSARKAPRWVAEGFASLISGERDVVESYVTEFPGDNTVLSLGDMEKELAREKDRKATRLAIFNAFRMVARLVDAHGDVALAGWIADLGDGVSRDDAARKRFGKSWDEVVLEARAWSEEEPR